MRNDCRNLWNNLWGTNYPQWYPFEPADANAEYRFRFTFEPPPSALL